MHTQFLLLLAAVFTALSLQAQSPEWIWHKKSDAAETRFFRTSFPLDEVPSAAQLIATADDALDVFINGQKVLSASEWQKAHHAEVKSTLKAGRNVIAVRGSNGDGSMAGLALKLSVRTSLGTAHILTDKTWKAEDREVPGWNQSSFDDASWPVAQVLGKMGMDPWGHVFASAGAPAAASPPTPEPKRLATPVDSLYVLKDFKLELILNGEPEDGSWVNLCKDHKGRLILSPQYRQQNTEAGLLRVTLDGQGRVAKREFIAQPLYDAQGMVFANDALWVVVNKYSTKFESGLYRITDDGSDRWGRIELIKALPGGGEHGPHAVELGPDGQLWVMAGNHTRPPAGLDPDSPYRHYQEDHVLPRQPDGNGHATGVMAPGGYICRVSPDGKQWSFFCGGFRNQYDFAFNPDDELFVFDADMEWDWGMPWYRATRVNHAVSGAEFGWRYGTGKWPDYYADSLGSVVDIGIGCPTGVGNGKGAKFPARYQRAIYAMDWTYGRLMAVHLTPDGAGYKGSWENFVAPAGLVTPGAATPPLNVTDLIIGDDGAMYFTIGGRGTASGLYRVTYHGPESITPAWTPSREGKEARALRRSLEAYHGKPDPRALDFIWPHLGNPDRTLRYAARIALEAQPVTQWQKRALEEKSAEAGLSALLALARLGGKSAQDEGWLALGQWPLSSLSERQQLDKLRVLQVSIARHGLPSPVTVKLAIEKLGASFPNRSGLVNRELSQVLIALGAPDVVGKSLSLMATASTQEDLIHFLFHLRVAKHWTLDQRREYLGYFSKDLKGMAHPPEIIRWFAEAGRPYGDGASFNNFRKNFLKEANSNMSEAERTELAPQLASLTAPSSGPNSRRQEDSFPAPKTRAFVKEWTMAELVGDLETLGKGRNFERGRQSFVDAQCLACHRFGVEGGGVGPDLTSVNTRFKRLDLLESMIDPHKVVSEQFQNTTVELKNGDDVTGRLMDETADTLVLVPNPLKPGESVTVKKSEVKSKGFSRLSPMPEGLLNTLSKEEILDLIAFMEAGGRRNHALFRP